jgi:hypothetical protein
MNGRGSSSGLQRTLSGFLLALLLVLWHAPLLAVVLSSGMDCGTSCCRKKKSCCCRKKALQGPARLSIGARSCPPGCGQPSLLPVNLLAWAAPGFASTFVVPVPVLLLALLGLAMIAAVHSFALFQRPPPAFCYSL